MKYFVRGAAAVSQMHLTNTISTLKWVFENLTTDSALVQFRQLVLIPGRRGDGLNGHRVCGGTADLESEVLQVQFV